MKQGSKMTEKNDEIRVKDRGTTERGDEIRVKDRGNEDQTEGGTEKNLSLKVGGTIEGNGAAGKGWGRWGAGRGEGGIKQWSRTEEMEEGDETRLSKVE